MNIEHFEVRISNGSKKGLTQVSIGVSMCKNLDNQTDLSEAENHDLSDHD